MLCESCGENQANTHIEKIVNGYAKEYMLCEKCVEKLGYSNMFNNFNLQLDDLLGSLFTENIPKVLKYETKRCEKCGSSIEDIANTSKIGCANCYHVFYDELSPSIKRIHTNTKHSGKLACSVSKDKKMENEIQKLENELQNAIKEQEFEKAAKIRDEIKSLKKEGNS